MLRATFGFAGDARSRRGGAQAQACDLHMEAALACAAGCPRVYRGRSATRVWSFFSCGPLLERDLFQCRRLSAHPWMYCMTLA